MSHTVVSLKQIQQLVLDIQNIERNHCVPGTDAHERVIDHCFSVAMMCWRVYEKIKPPLNLEKIFKYSLAHDFLERGLSKDISSYAGKDVRLKKKQREAEELLKIEDEFAEFL